MKKLFVWVTQSSLSGADLGLEMKSFLCAIFFFFLKEFSQFLNYSRQNIDTG